MSDKKAALEELVSQSTLLNAAPVDDEEPDLPSYSTPGRMLVEINMTPYFCTYRYEVEVLDHEGCTHWINEGVGFQYWIDEHIDLELDGFYVIDGIVGHYHRGTWGFDDDDEDWDFALVRRAFPEEIEAGTFHDSDPYPSDAVVEAALDEWFADPRWREVYADGPDVRGTMRRSILAALHQIALDGAVR